MIKLLCGLYQPQSGTLLFNDTPATSINRNSMKQRFGIVDQETKLFSGTIKENLLFVRPDASDEQCMQVLQQAQLETLITEHPL
ncbi:MAG: ABC transporter ATP-binding protein [Candidatus Peribacteria bacterium]|nr:MAG: ABC transporter ATP-binding protein [Candidatus Peribacteria bacterium]